MNINTIKQLTAKKNIALNIECGITLTIKDEVFRPGTVRVHLPAPINAAWLKEGQLCDSDPMFRMASVEDYPQRSVYYNERTDVNIPFSVKYAFTSEHKLITPDISLIDSTQQKEFDKEAIERFSSSHHCGCESYTALPVQTVGITDLIPDKGIRFLPEYREFLSAIPSGKNGSRSHSIYRFITENFDRLNRYDHNIAFVSMCRMCGIPARWQGGWAVPEIKENEPTGSGPASFRGDRHDWCMVYLLPYGWIYVDCVFGAEAFAKNPEINGIRLHDYFFGNLDPFMVPTASVPEADLYPAKDYRRYDSVYNAYGEVELIPGKTGFDGHFEGYGLKSDEYISQIYIAG